MQNKDQFTKIEIEPGGFAEGYIRGCTDTLQHVHKLFEQNRKKCEATGRDPLRITPSFIIVIRHAASLLLLTALALSLSACTGPRPQRGGHSLTTGPITQSLAQTENPAAPSRQSQDTIRTLTYTLPSASSSTLSPTLSIPSAPAQPSTFNFQPSTPYILTDRTETHATTELGAAQKDTARDLAAKLSSLKGITWLGAAIFILGLASLFWPPLQTIVGSVTTSAAITLGGLALIVLPTLIVGNEVLILGAVVLFVATWSIAHRHGHLRGLFVSRQVPEGPPPKRSSTTR